MAFIDITTEYSARYGTGSHRAETFISPGGQYPSQLKWSDLHPPGVKVLPKGAPPAGAGEINWEDTLGGQFALALEKLEGLLYAVYGSRPEAHEDPTLPPGNWIKWQWYDRQHPRCLWGAEIWEPQYRASAEPDYAIAEYVALGDSPPCCDFTPPQVPIRSRSGDPALQLARGVHDRTVFPLGSVSRDHEAVPHDPEGSGWFGATQPGRQDGVGYVQEAGQTVTFTYELPGGLTTPTSVTLFYQTRAPGGAWSGWSSIAMTGGPPTYTVQRDPHVHGTQMRWYLRYFFDDPNPSSPDVTRFDPGGDAVPADEAAYYLQWFTHFNPYANGLPEMLADYGGVDVRHGTDFYQFDGSETVQPELINMARLAVSWVCGTTCLHTDTGCSEPSFDPVKGGGAHHSPRMRGTGDDGHGLCCVPMPIRFYWSGSNVHPHYRRRGKGQPLPWSPLDTRPMTNHPDEPTHGLEAARKSWRGIDNLYRDAPFDNPLYGGGFSWGMAPGELVLWDEPAYGTDPAVYAKFENAGLQPGDVIDPIHLQEIIDAVDYLIDFGVWNTAAICTRHRTPGSYLGRACGHYQFDCQHDCPPPLDPCSSSNYSGTDPCALCCANDAGCGSPGFLCLPYMPPTLEDCRDDCQSGKCLMSVAKAANTCVDGCCVQDHSEVVTCNSSTCDTCGRHTAGPRVCPLDYVSPSGIGACLLSAAAYSAASVTLVPILYNGWAPA